MNLIATCARHMETDAQDELGGFLEEFGDSECDITVTEMSGVLVADTRLDPVEAVRRIRERLLDEPWSVRYCLRIIPVQREAEPSVEGIERAVSEMAKQIKEGETYRISVEKRNSDISSKELITRIAGGIKNRVSLEHPDRVILIEILGGMAGVSILDRADVLSVEKIKRSMSE